MEFITRNLRALSRVPKGIGIIGRLAWDVFARRVEGDELKKASDRFYVGLKKLFGIKETFNTASAPIAQNGVTWFVGNHQSILDFVVMGSVVENATFAGKELKLPERLLEAAKYIGIPRVDKEHPDFQKLTRMTQGRLIENFDVKKQSTITFPEATTTDGSRIALFRQGLLTFLFGDVTGLASDGETEIKLQSKVKMQVIAIKVIDVEGKSVEERPDLRHYYSHYHTTNTLKRIWTRLQTKSITVEIKASELMDPADYEDAKALANAGGEFCREYIFPDQEGFEKARIPGVKERGEKGPSARGRGLF